MFADIEIRIEPRDKCKVIYKVQSFMSNEYEEKEFVAKCRAALNDALVAVGIKNLD